MCLKHSFAFIVFIHMCSMTKVSQSITKLYFMHVLVSDNMTLQFNIFSNVVNKKMKCIYSKSVASLFFRTNVLTLTHIAMSYVTLNETYAHFCIEIVHILYLNTIIHYWNKHKIPHFHNIYLWLLEHILTDFDFSLPYFYDFTLNLLCFLVTAVGRIGYFWYCERRVQFLAQLWHHHKALFVNWGCSIYWVKPLHYYYSRAHY